MDDEEFWLFLLSRCRAQVHGTYLHMGKSSKVLSKKAKPVASQGERERTEFPAHGRDEHTATPLAAREHDELVDGAQELIEEGHTALAAGEARKALAFFERARARGLRFTDAHSQLLVERVAACNIANCHSALGDHEGCVAEHERCLRLSEQAGDTELAARERDNLNIALLKACEMHIDACNHAIRRVATREGYDHAARALGLARRMSHGVSRQLVERVSCCNLANAMQQTGAFSRAVWLQKRCLQLSLSARDARTAQMSRDNLHVALLSEMGERLRLTTAKGPRVDLPELDIEREEPEDESPLISATVDHFFRSPELQVAALLCTGVFKDVDIAAEWCLRMRMGYETLQQTGEVVAELALRRPAVGACCSLSVVLSVIPNGLRSGRVVLSIRRVCVAADVG